MRVKVIIFLLLLLFSTSACLKKSGQFIHRNITGKAGEMIVVMSKVAWDDKPGNLIRKALAQQQLSFPQEEPLFDLVFVSHEGFKEIFHTTRNIIQVKISPIIENAGVTFAENVWAYPQATVQINARNNEEFEKLFYENSAKIITYFLQAEQNRLVLNLNKLYEKNVYNTLEGKYSIFLKVPPGFSITSEGKDFTRIRFETPEFSQVLMIYSFPNQSDSAFTLKYLIQKRDSFLMANVPEPERGRHVTTELIDEPTFSIIRHHGNYAADIRGLYRVTNDHHIVTFIMLAEFDAYRQRIVVADGYVYTSGREKRNLIRQVEAMVYSLQFKEQGKNNKNNNQLKTGN